MRANRQKRLVHSDQYLGTLMEKGGLYSFALVFGGGSLLGFLATAGLLILAFLAWQQRSDPDSPSVILLLPLIVCVGFLSCVALWITSILFKAARQIEPVAPVTRHNTGLLPEVETLVRSSDRPAMLQATELLRAAPSGPATPPEQLLRATYSE